MGFYGHCAQLGEVYTCLNLVMELSHVFIIRLDDDMCVQMLRFGPHRPCFHACFPYSYQYCGIMDFVHN
jgi:hypothetical protein